MYHIEYKIKGTDDWERLPVPYYSCVEADKAVKVLQFNDAGGTSGRNEFAAGTFKYNVIFVGEVDNYSNDALPVIDKQPVDHVLIDEVV